MTINFDDLSSDVPKIKYGTSKRLIEVAETNPDELYPYFDYIKELINHKNNISL